MEKWRTLFLPLDSSKVNIAASYVPFPPFFTQQRSCTQLFTWRLLLFPLPLFPFRFRAMHSALSCFSLILFGHPLRVVSWLSFLHSLLFPFFPDRSRWDEIWHVYGHILFPSHGATRDDGYLLPLFFSPGLSSKAVEGALASPPHRPWSSE